MEKYHLTIRVHNDSDNENHVIYLAHYENKKEANKYAQWLKEVWEIVHKKV